MPHDRIQRYFRHGTLTQLRVFDAVARLGNGTRAAQSLHIAQPTVSVHLRKLSETIGVPLVENGGGKARLTAAGQAVHAACGRLFQTFSELDEALAVLECEKSARLRSAGATTDEYSPPLPG